MVRFRHIVIFIAVVFFGCGELDAPYDGQDRASESSALIDGNPDDEDKFPATGALVVEPDEEHPLPGTWLDEPEADLPDHGIWCTATLISKWHVLTAAHCLHSRYLDGIYPGFTLATDVRTISADDIYDVEMAHLSPDYSFGERGQDIAVLQLEEPVLDVPTAQLAPEEIFEEFDAETPVSLVGYGFRDWADFVHPLLVDPKAEQEHFPDYVEDYQPGVKQIGTSEIASSDSGVLLVEVGQDHSTTSNHDSGGPASTLLDGSGEPQIIATLAGPRVDEDKWEAMKTQCEAYADESQCTDDEASKLCTWDPSNQRCHRRPELGIDPTFAVLGSEYVSIDPHRDWIREVLEDTPTPAGPDDDSGERAQRGCHSPGGSSTPQTALVIVVLFAAAPLLTPPRIGSILREGWMFQLLR